MSYGPGIVRYDRTVALCHACHNFIHSGRLVAMYAKEEFTQSYVRSIFMHGFDLLKEAKLRPHSHSVVNWYIFNGDSPEDAMIKAIRSGYNDGAEGENDWEKWRMDVLGIFYPPRFNSLAEWQAEYQKKEQEKL